MFPSVEAPDLINGWIFIMSYLPAGNYKWGQDVLQYLMISSAILCELSQDVFRYFSLSCTILNYQLKGAYAFSYDLWRYLIISSGSLNDQPTGAYALSQDVLK